MLQKFCFLGFIVLLIAFNNLLKGQVSLNQYVQDKASYQSFDTIARNCWFVKQKNGKLGMMNALGEWVVPPVYNELGRCTLTDLSPYNIGWQNGILIVKKQGKYGAINCYGKEVIPCNYSSDLCFINDRFYIQDAKGKYLLYDRFGKLLKTKAIGNKLPLENGLTWIRMNDSNDDDNYSNTISYSLVNSNRDTLITLNNTRYIFNILGTSEGMTAFVLYPVIQGGLGETRGSVGFLNQEGKIVVPPIYSVKYLHGGRGMSAWEYKPAFHEGRALVFKGEQGIYIDKTGKEVLDFNQKIGKYNVYNDFNVFGFTLVYHWIDVEGKSILHKEIIDTNGQIVLDITDGVFGEDGLEYTDIYDFPFFFLVNKAGKTLYNANMEKQFLIPREDSLNKYYFFSYPGAIYTCIVRRNKQTGAKDYSFIDISGKEVYPYRSVSSFFDPFTETEICKEGSLLTMKNKKGEIVFSCDSCGYSPIFDLSQNSYYFYNSSGVFEIYKGKKMLLVNYKGMVLDEFTVPNKNDVPFYNMTNQMNLYTTGSQPETIKVNVTQRELDSIYQQMPWKNMR